MKKLKMILLIGAAMLALAGCSTAAAAETAPEATAAAVPAEREDGPLAFGREVWSVRRSADGGDAYVVRYAVFAREGDLVAVAPMFTTDPEAVRQALTDAAEAPLDGTGHLYLVHLDNCYPDQEAAQAAADKENGHEM